MMLKFLLLAYMLHMAIAAPQLLTFRDGKFGVNFGGYHAEAGLGGLLTGNAAHGGLSASAGTPFGQRAGAGLGGSVDGNAAGLLYAGAEANPRTGAGVILGGDTGKGGYAGSQAFAGGRTVASTKNTLFPGAYNNQANSVNTVTSAPSVGDNPTEIYYNGIQKVRPPKKYLIKPSYAAQVGATADANANANANTANSHPNAGAAVAHSKHLTKRVEKHNFDFPAPSPLPEMNLNNGPSVVTSALNIPIGILRSLQESLGGLAGAKQGSSVSNQ
ncbi:merozoite surface antigen 2 isoform X2 [Ceratitis capitata]|uniref:merozoite surface antigen 2 isoform X2 n=1 Tax=Ceratitis capitata TaxID=7213 RepID=UPI000329D5DC|nr:merozoite surface antigen 2 isoform X2 [Ceratitis capitata]